MERRRKRMLKEFKEFAMRGNVIDMAVGIIIGAAFGTIITSLVADVIMPPIGLLLGNVDFSNLFITLKQGAKAAGPYASLAEAKTAGAVTMNIGVFINTVISFRHCCLCHLSSHPEHQQHEAERGGSAAVPTTKDCPSLYGVDSD